jgi:hypothetical protein
MDGTALGIATAKLMEKIERVFGEHAEIVDALVIAEVAWTDEEGEEYGAVEWFCTSPRPVVREGIVAIASKSDPFVVESGDGPTD